MQSQKSIELPKRILGKHLSTFKDYNIETNYYRVKINQNIQEIYIYKVVFTPPIPADNSKQRMTLLQQGMPEIRNFIPSPVISGFNIYSLKPPVEKEREFKVSDHSIKIKQVKVINAAGNPKTLLMFLNNGLRNMFNKIGYTQIGKTGKFFQVKNAENIDQDLKMFSGFKANFMNLDKGIFLRVDSAKKIVRNSTVLDYINQIYSKNKNKQRDEKRVVLKTQLIGKIIMTNYGKTRYLKISDVIFQTVDELKLNGSETTLRAFYQSKYNRKIQNPKQPLVQVESKSKRNEGEKTILVPQMLLMTGIPDDFDQFKRKKVSQATIKDPAAKKNDIQQFMKQANSVNDLSSLKQLGIQIQSKLSQIKAKLIPNPRLCLGDGRAVDTGKQSGFNLFRDPIYQNKFNLKCGIFTVQGSQVDQFINVFKNTSKGLNIKFECEVYKNSERDKNRIIQAYFKQIQNAIRKNGINIALIVIPQFMKTNYGEIKRECLKKLNIVTQCIVDKTLKKPNAQSVATKLLLQMIAKRGNVLWVPKTTGKVNETMIMAFDNSKGMYGNSIVCCASVNETFSSYFSKTSKYNNNEDKFTQMVKLTIEAVNYYIKRNSRCPKEMIIFHNACTGDQVSLFRNFFLENLNFKLQQTTKNNCPNISLVMVNTKTNERFFTTDGGCKNVNAGTIVADEIVSSNYDFYLVSQGSNRGSTVPNHYKVVFTNSKIEQGLLHELIYSQCFNYVNWTGSIKIPGILQYAKKCAKFAAEALDGERVQQDLDSKLYFV